MRVRRAPGVASSPYTAGGLPSASSREAAMPRRSSIFTMASAFFRMATASLATLGRATRSASSRTTCPACACRQARTLARTSAAVGGAASALAEAAIRRAPARMVRMAHLATTTGERFLIGYDDAPGMTTWVNDVHSRLNATEVSEIVLPLSREDVSRTVRECRDRGVGLAVSGARHAMGGQQFRSRARLLDMRGMNRALHLDQERGLLRMESGAQWPEVVQATSASPWGIRQKQTGADSLTLGG